MDVINFILGTPFGYVMYWCLQLLGNYGWAIILFTILTKIILFPLSVIAQKNSIKMVKMAPFLEEIKHRYSGNGEMIIHEQKALYKKERYSTFAGLLPLLIQVPIILGLITVIYNPLQHLFHFDAATIKLLVNQTAQVLGIGRDQLGFDAQLFVLDAVKSAPAAFSAIPGISDEVASIVAFDTSFFGIDLSTVPSLTSITIIVPLFSGLSALALSLYQNRYNVLQAEQGFLGKWGMAIFLVAFSAYFAYALPSGLGLYWTTGNLLSIPVLWLCNLIYDPKKLIDYESRFIRPKLTPAEKKEKRESEKQRRSRSKENSRAFYDRGNLRELVFYSEASGFFKYFKGLIEYILENSDITVHYMTNDPGDQVFKLDLPRFRAYYINEQDTISFFLKLDADMMVMTTPDLDLFHIKRSIVRDDVEYVYLDHGMASLHLMLREHALDHFDTVFAYGPNHVEEVRQTEEIYGLPKKSIVKTGYCLLDELLERVGKYEANGTQLQILIAPSWQKDNILESCLDELLEGLLAEDYRVILRPHPEFIKRFGNTMDAIIERYKDRTGDNFVIELDFTSNETVFTSDVIITDWSSIAQEFSYATKRPSIFINTPMKIINPEYELVAAVPLEISLRDSLGVSVDLDAVSSTPAIIEKLSEEQDSWSQQIADIVEQNIYDIGLGAKGGGDYIISRILFQRKFRDWRTGSLKESGPLKRNTSRLAERGSSPEQASASSLTGQHVEKRLS
jgi:YidC/Oxa1 family membrane protein insertase